MIIVISLLSLLLSLLWFRSGLPLGSGESGILFVNPSWHFQATSYAWKSSLLGNIVGLTTASAPTYRLLSFFESIGIPTVFNQAFVVLIVLICSGIGIYLFTKELFPKLDNKYLFISVLFYWFNPFTLVNIWNRFINNYLIFFGLLPIALFLFFKGIKTGKTIYACAVAIVCLLFSFAMTSLPFNLILWFAFSYTAFFYFLLENKRRGQIVKFYLVTLVLFITTNFWWILQLFSLTSSGNISETISSFFTTSGNLATLTVLSDKLGQIQNLLRLKHGTFFAESDLLWRRIYDFPLFAAIEFSIPMIMLFTIWKKHKKKEVLYLGSLFILGIFLSKGNAMPLGEMFEYAFTKASSLQVFRNPFEKIGILLVIAAAPLVSYSFAYIKSKKLPYSVQKLLLVAGGLVVLVWSVPFITGLVFTGSSTQDPAALRSYQVAIPNSYEQVNQFFKQKAGQSRFLLFPLGGEGITYNWQNQYSGIELSASLFETPNIGLNTTIPHFDKIAGILEELLFTRSDFYKVARLLNAHYIVAREDIDWRFRAMTDPNLVKAQLENNDAYEKINQFGELSIYKVKEAENSEKIWVADSAIKVSGSASISDIFLTESTDHTAIYSSEISVPYTTVNLLKPYSSIYFTEVNNFELEKAKSELLYAKHLPGSILYPLSRFKENSERLSQIEPDAIFIHDLTHLGKRAMEIYRLSLAGDIKNLKPAVDNYLDTLAIYKVQYVKKFETTPENFSRDMVVNEFSKHLSLFDNAQTSQNNEISGEILRLKSDLNTWLREVGMLTYHQPLHEDQSSTKWVFRYDVAKSGEYELYIPFNRWETFFEEPGVSLQVQINQTLLTLPVMRLDDRLSLGKVNLDKGINEIWIIQPNATNLAPNSQINIDSSVRSIYTGEVADFDPYAQYVVTFDYWIKKGKSFDFSLVYDNDSFIDGELAPGFTRTISTDGYINDYKTEKIFFRPRSGASNMRLYFKAIVLNDCEEQRRPLSPSCTDPSFKRLFDKETEVEIKNVTVQKVFNSKPYLIERIAIDQPATPQIEYQKISPAEYRVLVKDATAPFLLVFSELFNSGWSITSATVPLSQSHLLVNGYANGWVIEKPGSYEATIFFKPQMSLLTGQRISFITAIVVLLFGAYLLWRKNY